MQITGIRALPVNIPFVAPYRFAYGSIASVTKTIVEVTTDDGVVGYGEAADGDRSAAIMAVAPRVIGHDPLDLDAIETAIVPGYAYSPWNDVLGAKRTFGAIEIALWDIRGKVEGKPLYELLGVIARLGPKNVFVSVFENNSKDKTPQFLALFTDLLKLVGVALDDPGQVEALMERAAEDLVARLGGRQ